MDSAVGSSSVKSFHSITPDPRGLPVCASQDCETKTHLGGDTRGSPTPVPPPRTRSFQGPHWALVPPTDAARPCLERGDPTHVPAPAEEAAVHPSSGARSSTPAVSPNPRGRRTRHSPSTNPRFPEPPPRPSNPASQESPSGTGEPHARRVRDQGSGGGLAAIPRPSTPHNGRCAHSPRAPTHAGLVAPRSRSRPEPPPQDPDGAAGAAWRRLSLSLRRHQPPPRPSPRPRPQPQPQRRSPGAGGAASVEPQSGTRTPGWRSLHMQRDRRPLARGRWRVRASANEMPAWGARCWRQGRGEVTTGHSSEPPPAGPG